MLMKADFALGLVLRFEPDCQTYALMKFYIVHILRNYCKYLQK